MKVMQVIPNLNVGGAETMMCNLSCELVDAGVEVIVVVFSVEDTIIKRRLQEKGIKIISLNKKTGFSFKIINKIRHIVKTEKPDAIHSHLHVLPYIYLASHGLKIIHTIHTQPEKERKGFAVYITRFIYHSSRVMPVAISKEIKKETAAFHHISKSKIPVVLNGISLSKYYKKSSYEIGDKIRLVHVGSLIPLKNHKIIIDVAEKLKNDGLFFEIECAGEGYIREELQKNIDSKKLSDCVKLVGLKDEINKFIKDADLFIFPSCYEGVPMSLIEAMASGLPVIASNVGGIPDMIEDGKQGILIKPDAEELYNAVIKLLNDKEMRERLGSNALTEAGRFSATNMCRKYIRLYESAE